MMKTILSLTLLMISQLSLAATSVPRYFCLNENRNGAILLQLDEKGGTSAGRISTPYTSDLAVLKQANPDPREYTKLNVGFVELKRMDSGRPFCADCYTFNASVYPLVNEKTILDQTKSILSKVQDPTSREIYLQLKFFIGVGQYMPFHCEKLN